MAKKKRKAPVRKKGKTNASVLTFIKQIFVTACVVIVCFIGIWSLYNYINPFDVQPDKKESVEHYPGQEEFPESEVPDSVTVTPEEEKSSLKEPETVAFEVPDGVEMSRLENGQPEEIVRHEGYTLSYNPTYKIANWVAYKLTSGEARSTKNGRTDKFLRDPQVSVSSENDDYTRSGYDRGHMAPAGDMKWSAKAIRESFYLSNICPQKPGLNRGVWKDLEEKCRLWAKEKKSVWIVTGPVINTELKRLGKNRVGIPRQFYKVVVNSNGNSLEGIAFLFENRDYKDKSLREYPVSIDSVEKITGIDFFHKLPDAVETKMESSCNPDKWML